MSGTFSVGGLMSGLDSETLVRQLMQLESQRLVRYRNRVESLEQEKGAVADLRTTLQDLRNSAQDFTFSDVFAQFGATSSEEDVATAEVTGANPVSGSYRLNVTQLASSTTARSSSKMGGAINPAAALNSSGIWTEVEAGSFTINGVTLSVDPASQSINDVLNTINASGAGVTATYDAVTDKVSFENATAGDTALINFGANDDDSNILSVLSVTGAMQYTGGNGSTMVTGTKNLGAINTMDMLNTVNFGGGAITAGSFQINGVSITVDPTSDSLSDVIQRINDSDAQVTASYDAASDALSLTSDTLGSRTISFVSGTSNFLDMTNLASATQTAGDDAQFTVNGIAYTRNTNNVTDVVSGVTLSLIDTGTAAVTVSSDDDAIVESIQGFLDDFNGAVNKIHELTAEDALMENDGSIRVIESQLRTMIFDIVNGLGGDYRSLLDIGITTGKDFDAGSVAQLQLDQEKFLTALRDDRTNIKSLFVNTSETGVANKIYKYMNDISGTSGFLYNRSKANGTIDLQIRTYNDQLDREEERLALRERRLRRQFTQLELMQSEFQSQSAALMRI